MLVHFPIQDNCRAGAKSWVFSRLGRSIPKLAFEVENMIGARLSEEVPLQLGEEILLRLRLPFDGTDPTIHALRKAIVC